MNKYLCAEGETRTRTKFKLRGLLRPVCLPFHHLGSCVYFTTHKLLYSTTLLDLTQRYRLHLIKAVILLKKYFSFISTWALNAVLLILANFFYPENFVLGTMRMGSLGASVVAGFVWTAIVFITEPVLKKGGINLGNGAKMILAYLAFNFLGLWVTARMAPLTGFGVTSYLWVFALAAFSNFAQYINLVLLRKAKIVN